MPHRRITTLVKGGLFFESPRWYGGRWYVSDIFRGAIVTLLEDGSDVRDFAVLKHKISGCGWLPDGSLLVADRDRPRVLRIDRSGAISAYADLAGLGRGFAVDMVVDREGRAFVGILGLEMGDEIKNLERFHGGRLPPPGAVVRVDRDGTATLAADGLITPNGMVITEDGSTLVVAETLACRLTAFNLGRKGDLLARRVWAEVRGKPDGCTLDREGHIWFADAIGSRFVHVAQGGLVIEEVLPPAPPDPLGQNTYACMLGGVDGRTLLMCCGPGHPPEGATAGQSILLSTTIDAPHSGLP